MIWDLIKIKFVIIRFKIKRYFFMRRVKYVTKVFNDFNRPHVVTMVGLKLLILNNMLKMEIGLESIVKI